MSDDGFFDDQGFKVVTLKEAKKKQEQVQQQQKKAVIAYEASKAPSRVIPERGGKDE